MLRQIFTDPYHSTIPPIVQPWIVPSRRWLLFFRHYWPWVQRAVVFAVLLLALWSTPAPWRTWPVAITLGAAYLFWQIGFDYLERRPGLTSSHWQHILNVIRHLGGILGLSLLIWLQPALSDQLWLLFLIPLLTIGISLDRHWAFGMIFLVGICLFLSAFSTVGLEDSGHTLHSAALNGMARVLIGLYIGFTSYILIRCLAYQYKANREAAHRLNHLTVSSNWHTAANTIATVMADLFSDTVNEITANVLTYDKEQGTLCVVGSSVKEGQLLAEEDFCFAADRGITGWAARHGLPCIINDTRFDPEQRYYHQNAFPTTRSALAAPVRLGKDQMAILEVESPNSSDFAQEDVQLLDTLGSHLTASHHRAGLLEVHKELAQLGRALAHSIIRSEAIKPMLERVGEVALRLLDAHIIGFYFQDPMKDNGWQRCTVGVLCDPMAPGSPVNASHSMVNRLINEGQERFFEDAQNDPYLTRKRPWHDANGLEPFVLREQIASCAVIPLVAGHKCIGLMYVNYRRVKEFTNPVKNLIRLLSPYALMAIQSSLEHALTERKRREVLRRIVHDSLAHRLQDVERGLDKLLNIEPGSDQSKAELLIMHSQVGRARRVVANLVGEQPWLTLQSVIDDLNKEAQLIEAIYGIRVKFSSSVVLNTPISLRGGNELMFACDEILGNALRHGQPNTISILTSIIGQELQLRISDDGVGFDVESKSSWGQGLKSIHARVQTLGGTILIESAPNQGTTVCLSIPVPMGQEA